MNVEVGADDGRWKCSRRTSVVTEECSWQWTSLCTALEVGDLSVVAELSHWAQQSVPEDVLDGRFGLECAGLFLNLVIHTSLCICGFPNIGPGDKKKSEEGAE